jgi:hypothetical protein
MNNDVRPIELHKPLLFIATEEHASDPATRAREYAGSQSNTYYVVVPASDHLSFTDARLIQSRFRNKSQESNISWTRALLTAEITRSLVGEFFGKYLKGIPAPALDLPVRVDQK